MHLTGAAAAIASTRWDRGGHGKAARRHPLGGETQPLPDTIGGEFRGARGVGRHSVASCRELARPWPWGVTRWWRAADCWLLGFRRKIRNQVADDAGRDQQAGQSGSMLNAANVSGASPSDATGYERCRKPPAQEIRTAPAAACPPTAATAAKPARTVIVVGSGARGFHEIGMLPRIGVA